jgi:hypothetical protein
MGISITLIETRKPKILADRVLVDGATRIASNDRVWKAVLFESVFSNKCQFNWFTKNLVS